MDKMNVITFSETGHVLGVVTRASQPETAVTVSEVIAASGFRLRDTQGDNIIVEIPKDEIGVALVDYNHQVIYQPHLYALVDGQPLPIPTASSVTIALDGINITATLPIAVDVDTKISYQVSGGDLSEPIYSSITIEATLLIHMEPLPLSIGDYNVAIFAPGYALAVFTEPVP